MFSYQHPFETEPFYINEKYKNEETLFIEHPAILWEIRYIENDCGILVLKPYRKLIAVLNNDIIIEAKGVTYGKLDVSTIKDDGPVLIEWINVIWRILDMYWQETAPLYSLKPKNKLNIEEAGEEIFNDLKKQGFYL
jgi:hypothetical protein